MLREGKSQKDIARSMNVSEAAICKAKRELNINVVKNVALENAHRVTEEHLDAVQQVQKINVKANKMLDQLTGEDKVINRIVKAVEGVLAYEGDPVKQKAYIRKVVNQINSDRNLTIKIMSEIRGQLNLQLEIFQALYSMKAVQEFQREVLEIIGEIEPDAKRKIVQRLKERSALRAATHIT
ncbi:MAG: hypothetical protein J7L78_03385 [Dehalococcoidales bacterium]|nr:hypothetical protein [Dehalococcoidales bacterium]